MNKWPLRAYFRLLLETLRPDHVARGQKTHGTAPGSEPSETDSTAANADESKWLLCGRCNGHVTRASERREMAGSHSHVFRNPHGVLFEIGCFQSAPGVLLIGEPTNEDTWFPGYAWDIAVCRHCHHHLGWFYEGPSRFYGLILSRLIHAPDD